MFQRVRIAIIGRLGSRPPWDLAASVKWMAFSGIFMYGRNMGDPDDPVWRWGESYFGIPVPTLTAPTVMTGLVAAALLVSLIFLIEPLLPTGWSRRTRTIRTDANWILMDGGLSWGAFVFGMLTVFADNLDWWGGEVAFMLWFFMFVAMPFKLYFDVRKVAEHKEATAQRTRC